MERLVRWTTYSLEMRWHNRTCRKFTLLPKLDTRSGQAAYEEV